MPENRSAILNQSAGHTPDLKQWEESPAGQEFIKGAKDRDKVVKEQTKVEAESEKAAEPSFKEDADTKAEEANPGATPEGENLPGRTMPEGNVGPDGTAKAKDDKSAKSKAS